MWTSNHGSADNHNGFSQDILIAADSKKTCMDQEESNYSTEFSEETSKKKPLRPKVPAKEMDDSTEKDDILDYERDKDVGA